MSTTTYYAGGSVVATSFTGAGTGLTSIPRTSLSSGTANQILVNDANGNMSQTSTLSTALGGTGQNLSTTGAGPYVLTVSNGTVSSTLGYSSSATASTLVERDASGNVFANAIAYVPSALSGGESICQSANLQTTNATTTTLFSLPTASGGTHGTAYFVTCNVVIADTTGGVNYGSSRFSFIAKNVGGTLTVSSISDQYNSFPVSASTNAAPWLTLSFSTSIQTPNALVQVTGLASTTLNWNGYFVIVSQNF